MSQSVSESTRVSPDGLSLKGASPARASAFDEVEWEIRDAIIGDPPSPPSEQRGVEFPGPGRRTRPTSSPRITSGASSARRKGELWSNR